MLEAPYERSFLSPEAKCLEIWTSPKCLTPDFDSSPLKTGAALGSWCRCTKLLIQQGRESRGAKGMAHAETHPLAEALLLSGHVGQEESLSQLLRFWHCRWGQAPPCPARCNTRLAHSPWTSTWGWRHKSSLGLLTFSVLPASREKAGPSVHEST